MQLTGEQINEFLSNAVLDSQIGEVVKQRVAAVIKELSQTWNNPFDAIIKQQVCLCIEKYVAENLREKLAENVRVSMEKLVTDEVVKNLIDTAFERLKSRY